MKITDIKTRNRKLTLAMDVMYHQPVTLRVIGYDPERPKTVYFDRVHWENSPGSRFRLEFPFAVSPNKLNIEIANTTNGDETAYTVETATSYGLREKKDARIHPQTHEFFEFIKWFAQNAAYLPPKLYRDKKKKFKLYYFNDIIDKKDGKIDTAARADHYTNDMQFAKSWMQNCTVPAAIVIGLHEYMHLAWNTWDETEADLRSVDVALCKGLPKNECLYAYLRIFNNNGVSAQRAKAIEQYIDNWEF